MLSELCDSLDGQTKCYHIEEYWYVSDSDISAVDGMW